LHVRYCVCMPVCLITLCVNRMSVVFAAFACARQQGLLLTFPAVGLCAHVLRVWVCAHAWTAVAHAFACARLALQLVCLCMCVACFGVHACKLSCCERFCPCTQAVDSASLPCSWSACARVPCVGMRMQVELLRTPLPVRASECCCNVALRKFVCVRVV
jgi:hypothetical protein